MKIQRIGTLNVYRKNMAYCFGKLGNTNQTNTVVSFHLPSTDLLSAWTFDKNQLQ